MKLDRLRLDGQVALITGGGRGIGRGIATVLSEAGAAVVVTARSPGEIQETVELVRKAGGRAIAVQGDVTKRADNARLVEATLEEFGQIDIVVNNAGGSGGLKPFAELTEELFIDDFRLNTLSAFTLTQLAAPHMADRRFGEQEFDGLRTDGAEDGHLLDQLDSRFHPPLLAGRDAGARSRRRTS